MKSIHASMASILAGLGVLAQAETQPAALAGTQPVTASRPAALTVMETDAGRAGLTFLSWDTEGWHRDKRNLLRAPAYLRWRVSDRQQSSADVPARRQTGSGGATQYRIAAASETELAWSVQMDEGGRIVMTLSAEGAKRSQIEHVEMVFPFDPAATPTTVLPADYEEDGHLHLPAIISAPDFGQMLLTCASGLTVRGRLEGSRDKKMVDFIVEIPLARLNGPCSLELRPVYLAPPKGLRDVQMWLAARRGWYSIFQATARWGEQGKPFSSPPGLLGNNVLSDPASVALSFYADQAMWTPQLAPGVSVIKLVRRTLEYWMDHRTRPTGEVVGYWDYGGFLDANAAILIAAWDYVEATNDREWLATRIERIEFIADFLAKRDIDGDGMIEATQSGNRNALQQPGRSCAWWDALNCGHKDGYTNAIIYRAFRCLAELEGKAGRAEQAARYTHLADALKATYAKTLYNPQTGWLAWWKSQDGELHDYASPVVNGLAIEYGLVEPAQGKQVLARLRAKMKDVGFTRFDLGVPPMLVPVPRYDYLLPDAIGCPKKDDGTDTFGQYMNGGITAGQVLHFLAAHYVVGQGEEADKILRAMLTRQSRGEFQNGVQDAAMRGIDWTTWDGKPSGYEGYLADSSRFLQAVLLREKPFRDRLYRPLTPQGIEPR